MSPSLALIKKKKSKKLSHSFNCTLIRVFTCVAFFYLQNPRHLPQDVSVKRHA